MPEGNRKPEVNDPEMMARLLELELAQKRAGWQRSHEQRKNLRIFSFLFLFCVIGGAFLGFYFFFSPDRIGELKSQRSNAAETSPSPKPRP